MTLCRILSVSLLLAAFASHSAFAQVPPIPPSVDAGHLENQLTKPTPQTPALSAPDVLSPEYKVEVPKGAEKIKFVLKAIDIKGSTVYSQQQLREFYADKLNKEVSLADIYIIAGAITQRYRRDGYILSHAVVPPQEIGDGKATITVIEGYVGKVTPEGKAYHDNYAVRGVINGILSMRPFNAIRFERLVLLLNDLAGVNAHAIMEAMPDKNAPQGAIMVRLVFDKRAEVYSISEDNYGTRYLGPLQTTLSGGVHGILNPYDQFILTGIVTTPSNEMRSGNAQYKIPLSSNGIFSTTSFNASEANPGYRLEPYNLENRSNTFSEQVSWEAIRQRAESLVISSAFYIKDIRSEIVDQPLYDDRIRSIRTAATYSFSDKWGGVNSFDSGFTQGLNILNASTTGSADLSRPNGRSDFSKIDFNTSRLQDLPYAFQAYVAATGQFSAVPLLTAEQFGFGGQVFGRGYDPSEITGDDGLAGSVELRYNGIPTWQKITGQPFVFYDVGQVWDILEKGTKVSGASAGFGTRTTFDNMFSGTLTVAKPLTSPVLSGVPDDGNSMRVFFSVTAQY